MRIFFVLALLLFCSIGCGQKSPAHHDSNWQVIPGRDEGHSLERQVLYRAMVPSHWVRRDPAHSDSIVDTVKPNVEFFIREKGEEIRLTVHTFPYLSEETRIPPQAQIARWKKQLDDLELLSVKTTSESHGGFSGLYFEGEGKLQDKQQSVLGWSMRLGNGFDQQLKRSALPSNQFKRADYTIKAVGSPNMIHEHRQEIGQFAQSFELIDELPPPV